jgi:hypothetical protein
MVGPAPLNWSIPNEFELPPGVSLDKLPQLAGGEINPMAYDPPGPVGAAYMFAMDPIAYIMGPIGSAKTTCSFFKIMLFAMRMPPCADGVIRVRGMVLHANFRALYRTAKPSIDQFVKPGSPGVTYSGGQDRPFQYVLQFATPNGKKLQIVIDGFGITKDSAEELLRGYQANFAWCVEADLLDPEIPEMAYSRVAQGRYPGRHRLADPDANIPGCVWGDLNPPPITNYVYSDFVEAPREGYKFYWQPSGLADNAENRKYTRLEDYQKLDKTMKKDKARRLVRSQFGLQGDGAMVYGEEYDHEIHCARQKLEPLDLPLLIGSDAGGSPALIIGQVTPKGHMRWLDELVTEPGTGAGRFAEMLINMLQANYRGLPIRAAWGDPSAFHGADRMAGELSFMEIVGKAIGVQMLPTVTNEPSARQESVAWFLRQRCDSDGVPWFQYSPHMKVTMGGFLGGFIIAKNPHGTADTVKFVKNKFSHVHEGGQYLCYGYRGHAGVINDAARAGRPGANVTPIGAVRVRSDFNAYDV